MFRYSLDSERQCNVLKKYRHVKSCENNTLLDKNQNQSFDELSIIAICNMTCYVKSTVYTDSQKHESTLLYTYVCTERIFDSRPFMYNKIFLKK